MRLSRRLILRSAGALPLLAGSFGLPLPGLRAQAQTAPSAPEIPPILFVHGNGDHGALWITTLWRMESNGVPQRRCDAVSRKTQASRLVGHHRFRWPSVTGLIPFELKVMPAKTPACPVAEPRSTVLSHS